MREPPRLRRHPRLLEGALKPRPKRVPRRIESWVWLSRILQFLESLLPALWPALGVAALFVTLAFLDVWRFVGPDLQGLIVTGFLATIVGLGWLGLATLRFPDRQAGLRRLELDSGLVHRPLSAFEDRPATGLNDPVSRKLWAAHRARQMAAWQNLELAQHDEALARRDPFALRWAALLAVVVTGVAAGPDWDDRLGSALMPRAGAPIEGLRADLWVTPPDYTGAAPVFLTGEAATAAEGPVKVPAGSVLNARVGGTSRRIRLRADPTGDGKRVTGDIKKLDDGIRESRLTLDQDSVVSFRVAGRTIGRWNFEVTPDQPPAINLVDKPKSTSVGALELAFRASDDYGVVSAQARVTLVPRPDEMAALESAAQSESRERKPTDKKSANGEKDEDGAKEEKESAGPSFFLDPAAPVTLPLSLTEERAKEIEHKLVEPLADHPWAGREVLLQLIATDDPGQKGFSRGVKLVMPERKFTEPLAMALIEQRKLLATDPYAYPRVATVLGAFLVAPERFYDDKVVFLGLKSAHWRLTEGMAGMPRLPKQVISENLETVFDLLWDLAIRIEDGDLSLALDRLRQAQEALKQALKDGASDAELRRLMAELRDAVSAYIQALIESGRTMAELPEGMAESMSSEDLSGLLDKLEQLTETGARDAAQSLLSDLSALLENLQIAKGSGGGLSQSEQAMSEAIEELSEIIGAQRKVLDDTFRGAQGRDETPSFEEQFRDSFGQGQIIIPGDPQRPFSMVPKPDAPGTEENKGAQQFRNAPEGGANSGRPPELPDVPEMPAMPGMPKSPAVPGEPPVNRKPAPDAKPGSELAKDQNAVREKLGEVMTDLQNRKVQVPGNLGEADRAMGEARERLAQNDYDGALPPERDAIDKLREGAESLAQKLTEQLSKRQAMGVGSAQGRDPLGRRPGTNGLASDGSVNVPDESALQEARRILDELRRRAAERGRPEEELEYLDRLLKRF